MGWGALVGAGPRAELTACVARAALGAVGVGAVLALRDVTLLVRVRVRVRG